MKVGFSIYSNMLWPFSLPKYHEKKKNPFKFNKKSVYWEILSNFARASENETTHKYIQNMQYTYTTNTTHNSKCVQISK